jgi:hypothetical protein
MRPTWSATRSGARRGSLRSTLQHHCGGSPVDAGFDWPRIRPWCWRIPGGAGVSMRTNPGMSLGDSSAAYGRSTPIGTRSGIGPDGVNVVFRVDPAIPPSIPAQGDYAKLYKV